MNAEIRDSTFDGNSSLEPVPFDEFTIVHSGLFVNLKKDFCMFSQIRDTEISILHKESQGPFAKFALAADSLQNYEREINFLRKKSVSLYNVQALE